MKGLVLWEQQVRYIVNYRFPTYLPKEPNSQLAVLDDILSNLMDRRTKYVKNNTLSNTGFIILRDFLKDTNPGLYYSAYSGDYFLIPIPRFIKITFDLINSLIRAERNT
jgi:hypothetical protein